MGDEGSARERTQPVAVLHERSGAWSRQLRARLADAPARWFETRSTAELRAAIEASASPVVLIEAGADPVPALLDLAEVVARGSDARILFLDPAGRPDVLEAARELGATLAESHRATPPEVAGWFGRWLRLSARAIEREGWTRPLPADPARDPSAWIDGVIAEAARAAVGPAGEPDVARES